MADGALPVRACPKCGHVRAPDAAAPAWQCPACGIAYRKYAEKLAAARAIVTPPGAGEPAPRLVLDGSLWALIVTNVVVLAIAFHQGWTTLSLMLAYWTQSVIIGVANTLRILALDRFSTENFRINDRPVEPTPAVRMQTALFFMVHYGFFHAGYLVFLVADSRGALFGPWFWPCVGVFALNHIWSYRYNRDIDRRGTPNIGTLMFTPYLRVVPMHLMIVLGHFFVHTAFGMVLFGALKTCADVAMHCVEHAQLKKVREQPVAAS